MKKHLLALIIFTISADVFAQADKDKTEKTGLFKNLNVKTGLTMSYFHNFQGEYVYILQQNARVVEQAENHNGASLSLVVLFPLDKGSKANLLLNIPVVDIKDNATFFNSQTPFGLGIAWFPLNNVKFLGISAMANFGRQDRMRQSAIDNEFFPIATNSSLKVDAPVPQSILDPYTHKVTTISANAGIIIRL